MGRRIFPDGIRGQKEVDAVTTSNAGTTQFTKYGAVETMLLGGGSNHVGSLPDASTLFVGWTKVVTNASTEVAIVQNYGTASSVMEWLLPGDTLTCVCTSIATAAGTWVVTKIDAPESKKIKFFDDMLNVGNSTTLEPSQGRMLKGTGSSSALRGDSTHGCNGVHVMSLGTDAGLGGYVSQQYFGYDNTSTPLVSGKALLMACKVYVYNQSDATNETVFRFGTLDNNTKVKPTSGIFVETDQDGDIIGVTGVSSSYTNITGGGKIKTNGDSTASEMVIVVKSDLSRVDLWVDKAHIGSSTTNIPTASLGSVIGYHYGRVAGTGSSRDAYVDYFRYERVK